MILMIVLSAVIGLIFILMCVYIRNRYGKYASGTTLNLFILLGLAGFAVAGFTGYRYFTLPCVADVGELLSKNWVPYLKQSCSLNKTMNVKVLPFKSTKDNSNIVIKRDLPAAVESVLSRYLTLLEKKENALLGELTAQQNLSELFDPATVAELGKKIGANYLVVGEASVEGSRIKFLDLRIVNVEKGIFCGQKFTIMCDVFGGCKVY